MLVLLNSSTKSFLSCAFLSFITYLFFFSFICILTMADDSDGMVPITPLEARDKLLAELTGLQNQMASLIMLRAQDGRRDQIASLRSQLDATIADIALLDELIASTPRPVPSRDLQDVSTHPQLSSAVTVNRVESRLPSSLPVFRGSGITDPDAFIEQLSNNLLAHDVSASRLTSALLLGCAEPADASFVQESLFILE